MRSFSCPAAYRAFLEGNLRLTLAEIARDIDRRGDEDPRIRTLATVPEQFIDSTAEGTIVILVGGETAAESASAITPT